MRRLLLTLALATLAMPALGAPSGRPRIAPRITPQVAEGFYACRGWEDWKTRPIPSPERAALALGGGVVRQGLALHVAGRVLHNIRSAEELEREWFQYVGRLSNAPVEVVLDHPYEGVSWIAIDRDTHARVKLRGLPLASPGGRRLAVAASDFVFDMSGVEVWERGHGFIQVGDAPRGDYPCGLHWVGDDRLEFRFVLRQSDDEIRRGEPRLWRPAALVNKGGVWVYEGREPPP